MKNTFFKIVMIVLCSLFSSLGLGQNISSDLEVRTYSEVELENGIYLFQEVTLSDTHFDFAEVKLSISSGVQLDQLTIHDSDLISVDPQTNNIVFGELVIGVLSGELDPYSDSFYIQFNASARMSSIQAILRNIFLFNQDPKPEARNLSVKLKNANNQISKIININQFAMPQNLVTFDEENRKSETTVALVDIDNDNDLDLFIGDTAGDISFYRNNGDAKTPIYSLDADENPLSQVNSLNVTYTAPAFVDIDDDGDVDFFLGENNGFITFYENIGSKSEPKFVLNNLDNPFKEKINYKSKPNFLDVNTNGLVDALFGRLNGGVSFYQNIGTKSQPDFVLKGYGDNIFQNVRESTRSAPFLYDFDSDGVIDLLLGETDGSLNLYFSKVINETRSFIKQDEENNQFSEIYLGEHVTPIFVDINNDGFADLISGNKAGEVKVVYDDSQFTFEISAVNDAPIIDILSEYEIGENTKFVTSLTIKDEENDSYQLALSGDDATQFEILTDNTLAFISMTNFEKPTDDNTDNIYNLTVQVTDALGASSHTDINVVILDINEVPTITGGDYLTIKENSTELEIFEIANPETESLIVELLGDDSSVFTISDNGQLSFVNPADFENPLDNNADNVYLVTILVTDSIGQSGQIEVSISVENELENISAKNMDVEPFDENDISDGLSAKLFSNIVLNDLGDDFVSQVLTISGLLNGDNIELKPSDEDEFIVYENEVIYQGNLIATIDTENNGLNGANFSMLFTEFATGELIHKLFNSLMFSSDLENPQSERVIRFNLSHPRVGDISLTNNYRFDSLASMNPFNGMDFGKSVKPSFVDLDNDGDLDGYITEFSKRVNIYTNETNGNELSFIEQSIVESPHSEYITRYESALAFSDINNDDKIDVLVGENDGTLDFFLNTGTPETPQFSELLNENNPWDLIDVGSNSTPVFVDIDGDADDDLFVGSLSGHIYYFENTSDEFSLKFNIDVNDLESHILTNVSSQKSSAPSFVDFDSDGDLDLVLGNAAGTLQYFNNIGNFLSPIFVELVGEENPLHAVLVSSDSAPIFVDLDKDGDSDLFVGSDDGKVSYFQNNSGILIEILGENDAPQVIVQPLYSVIENRFEIGQASFTDADGDQVTFMISGDDAHWFNIDGNGVMSFKQLMTHANPLDADADNVYQFSVTVEDPLGGLSTVETSVEVTKSEPVDFTQINSFLVSENSTFVALINLSDADDMPLIFTFSGEDEDAFEIDALGQLVFKTKPDFEHPLDNDADNIYELTVITTNTNGDSLIHTIDIKVIEVNEAPQLDVSANINVLENNTDVTQVQVIDPENEVISFTLSGADEALFIIDETGMIQFVTLPNYEYPTDSDLNNQYDLVISVMDARGAVTESQISIMVMNVDEMVYEGELSLVIFENTTFVQTVEVNYTDQSEFSYQLLGDDAAGFQIDENANLSFINEPNFEAPSDSNLSNVYQIIVKMSDAKGETLEIELNITVLNVNETPSILSSNSISVDENTQLSYELEMFDPESDPLTVSLSGNDSQFFELVDGYLVFNQLPNFEAPHDSDMNGEYSLTLSVTDGLNVTNLDLIVEVLNHQEQAEVTGLTDISLGQSGVTNGNTSAILPDVTLIDPDNNFNDHQIFITGLLSEDSIILVDNNELELSFNATTGEVFFRSSVIAQIAPENNGINGANFLISFNELATNEAVEAVVTSLSYRNNSDQPTATRTLSFIIKDEVGNQLNLYNAVDFLSLETNVAPLFNIVVGENASPSFADIDNDNDLDLIVGNANGELKLFINEGTAISPEFKELASNNPVLAEFASSFHSTPSFVDIDNDGDQDLFIGDSDGFIRLVKNTSTNVMLGYEIASDSDNPFSGIDAGSLAKISFVDIDSDNDYDAFISNNLGNIRFFLNTGSAITPSFTEKLINDNPLYIVKDYFSVATAFIDIDKDEDFDLVLGNSAGTLILFENTGNAQSAIFEISNSEDNPILDFAVKGSSVPVFVDIDGDSDLDLFVGDVNGQLSYSKNVAGINLTIDKSDDVNIAPVITLDSEQTVNAGDFVILEAKVEDDETTNLSYKWHQNSGDAIDMLNNDSYKFTFTAPMVDTDKQFEFELIAHDGELASSSIVVVNVKAKKLGEVTINNPPTVELVSEMVALEDSELLLQAVITDIDGDELIYSWTQTSGITVEMLNTDSLTPTLNIPLVEEQSIIVIQFEVSDGDYITEKSVSILIEMQDEVAQSDSGGVLNWYLFLLMFMLIPLRRVQKTHN